MVFLNRINEGWVQEARRISPRLLIDLLAFSGPQLFAYFDTHRPRQVTAVVSWAGPDPSPVWLDVAREYTERWFHQQRIRDAVTGPATRDPRFLAPVLATSSTPLPAHLPRHPRAGRAPAIHLHITAIQEATGPWYANPPSRTLSEGSPD